MPSKRKAESEAETQNSSSCSHANLWTACSPNAARAGYRVRTATQLAAAAAFPKCPPVTPEAHSESTFPLPLVLPDDDLSYDPSCPAQSLKEWLKEEDRNPVAEDRRIIYVAGPPTIHKDVDFIAPWSIPSGKKLSPLAAPSMEGVSGYLNAFYLGMEVRPLPLEMRFVSWDEPQSGRGRAKASTKNAKVDTTKFIGLAVGDGLTRIRTRSPPDGRFPRQLNSDDLLDALLSVLPDDAYATVMLVPYDLWEGDEKTDDDDCDFICGRAYGASRISVVSTARYDPRLDEIQDVEELHAWPAAHCATFVQDQCQLALGHKKKRTKRDMTTQSIVAKPTASNSPLRAAVDAYTNALVSSNSASAMTWLARVTRTTAHELGHCFGLDHCVYAACSMQGTAGLSEDARQPPYLCSICVRKVVYATSFEGVDTAEALADVEINHSPKSARPRRTLKARPPKTTRAVQAFPSNGDLESKIKDRYEALRDFCSTQAEAPLFAAHAAWLSVVLNEIEQASEPAPIHSL